tara:strand:+ start:3778 stop:5436 length:1659 start_codon:yes stop_codon:yes gene_type:complete
MALDATAFSEEFSTMFAAFAEQQNTFQDNFLAKLDDISNAAGSPPEKEKEKTSFFGRPKAKAAPRQVKKEVIKVFIEDISNKAANKLMGEEKTPEEEKEEGAPKTKMGLLSLIGGLLGAGAVAVIGKVFGAGAGAGVAGGLLAKIGPLIFKPLKLVAKRLPIIGSLFSFYEAYQHFKAGGLDNIILGLLDVAAGIAYAIPGFGTIIGLGIDVLSFFINERVEEHKAEGGDTSFFGGLYDKVIEYLSETDQIKWMVELGELFGELWDNPTDLKTWKAFGMHLGGPIVSLLEMLNNFDKKAGAALGITDDKGESMGLVAKLVQLVNEYVVDPIVEMIKNAFKYVKDAIVSAATKVTDTAKSIGGKALEYSPAGLAFKGVKGAINWATGDDEKQEEGQQGGVYGELLMQKGDPESKEQQALYDEIMKDDDRAKKFWEDIDKRKNLPALPAFPKGGLKQDFAVINGKLVDLPKSAIISGGNVQGFSGDDTVIGFKEGEALVTGINSLIEVGENQLKALREYLETASQNVIAPTSNSSNTYNFSVETDVSSFRKLVT